MVITDLISLRTPYDLLIFLHILLKYGAITQPINGENDLMAYDPAVRITKLQASVEPLSPEDAMAEAGRKVLLNELIKILSHETGSRTDLDLEDVHQMRVAIRRIRSLFRLLRPHFKKSVLHPFDHDLASLGALLGEVRDLDVLLANLRAFQPKRKQKDAAYEDLLNELERQRQTARQDWVNMLESRNYQSTVKSFGKFLTSPGKGAKAAPEGKVVPTQSRHVLPVMIYEHLAAVRAYETALDDMDAETFHNLRISFKRLRYLVSLFQPILGKQIQSFIEELKLIQDCLGEMHDCTAARDRLHDLPETFQPSAQAYLTSLDERESVLRAHFFELWLRFNTRRVQQQLASAIVGLH
jgi:CHAD domain-containing protein